MRRSSAAQSIPRSLQRPLCSRVLTSCPRVLSPCTGPNHGVFGLHEWTLTLCVMIPTTFTALWHRHRCLHPKCKHLQPNPWRLWRWFWQIVLAEQSVTGQHLRLTLSWRDGLHTWNSLATLGKFPASCKFRLGLRRVYSGTLERSEVSWGRTNHKILSAHNFGFSLALLIKSKRRKTESAQLIKERIRASTGQIRNSTWMIS